MLIYPLKYDKTEIANFIQNWAVSKELYSGFSVTSLNNLRVTNFVGRQTFLSPPARSYKVSFPKPYI